MTKAVVQQLVGCSGCVFRAPSTGFQLVLEGRTRDVEPFRAALQ